MLNEGRQAKAEGIDVVVGYLEPHDRPETAAQAEGLEQVPRSELEVGGRTVAEMDTEAVIRRAPQLALVDELAHTNAPGSPNAKRYEDIDEILEAGIDVVSTVNVQHLESLNDLVFELTGVRVRETFPDRVLDQADQVVLVDLTPEELQLRLRAGKVYPGREVERALMNFFKHENLAALRELALREVAEDVEARRHPTVLDPTGERPVAERILALVTPQARSQRLLRRAWRSAQRLQAELDILWIRRPEPEARRTRRSPSSQPSGGWPSCSGGHFLEEEARRRGRHGARGRGRPRHDVRLHRHARQPRREEVRKGSLVMRLVRALPGIDIRIVADPARREELDSSDERRGS